MKNKNAPKKSAKKSVKKVKTSPRASAARRKPAGRAPTFRIRGNSKGGWSVTTNLRGKRYTLADCYMVPGVASSAETADLLRHVAGHLVRNG